MAKILKSNLLSNFPEIHHGTSTKKFGPLSFKYSPDSNKVIIDRAKFLTELDLPLNHSVLLCEQNHTDNVVIVGDEDMGKGVFESNTRIPNADAMITRERELNLVIYTADCLPILIFDPVKKVIAAVHSGWKGTVKKIVIKTLEKMNKEFSSSKKDCLVHIGPSIGPCCYAVDNTKQIDLFDKSYQNVIKKEDKVFIDLWDSVEKDLLKLGIPSNNIDNPKICTACHNQEFASRRADHPRLTTNLSVISMV